MRRVLPALIGVVALVAAACGTGENPAFEGPPQGTAEVEETPADEEEPAEGAVSAELSEFDITLGQDSAPAGEVTFAAENVGQIDHEFLVIDTELPEDELPQSEGKVEEDSEELEVVGEIDEVSPGDTETLTTELEAGEYVLICNIAGHYDSGMFTSFTAE